MWRTSLLFLSLSLSNCILLTNALQTECGDGFIQESEACDDGNNQGEDGCDAICVVEFCGDNIVQFGLDEECEGGGCTDDCRLLCGDGIVDPDEECDDGNHNSDDGCDSNCTVTGCGNGILTSGEVCDDGNLILNDGCDDLCQEVDLPALCGDGAVNGDEQCDDGNEEDGDGCDLNCTVTSCGNLLVTSNEECDDGKQCTDGTDCTLNSSLCAGIGDGSCLTRDNDGCTSACTFN